MKDVERTFTTFVDVDSLLPERVFLLRKIVKSNPPIDSSASHLQSTIDVNSSGEEESAEDLHLHSTASTDSRGSHPVVELSLQSRFQSVLKLLSQVTDEEDFATILLHPVVKRTQQISINHATLEGPVDIATTTALMRDALDLAQRAREEVHVTNADKSLSETQADDASAWLQHCVFEPHYMRNEPLKQQIHSYDTSTSGWGRKETTSVRCSRRGAFKVWVHERMGNTALFRAIVKHGFFDTQSLSEFMVAFNPGFKTMRIHLLLPYFRHQRGIASALRH